MLKKIFSNMAYLAMMLSLGFAIYYFLLNPNSAFRNLNTDYNKLSTLALFSSNLPNENGVNQDLSQYKGKIIVLNFWATWCSPCREEMPDLSELHTKFINKNVVVLGVAVDELALVKAFAQATPVSYPLFAADNVGMELSYNLGNDKGVLPYTVIINASGQVVNTYFGRIDKMLITEALQPLLAH